MIRKIYIVDDEKNIRELIYAFLSNEGYAVKTFASGEDFLDNFAKDPCDLVILDVMLGGVDGFVVSSRLRKISNVPIIIVSARDSEIDKITGITLGSDDYLTKPFSPMELVARVKALFRRVELDAGCERRDSIRHKFADLVVNSDSRDITVGSNKIDLTPTEYALIVYLIDNNGKAISREELLKNVWKFDFDTDTRATDDVVKRLRKKLSAAGSQARIESVWGFGFILEHTEA